MQQQWEGAKSFGVHRIRGDSGLGREFQISGQGRRATSVQVDPDQPAHLANAVAVFKLERSQAWRLQQYGQRLL